VTPQEALALAQGAARLGQVRLTEHARERALERGVQRCDLESAVRTSMSAVWSAEHGSWRLSGGVDLDGEALAVAVAIDGTVVKVITVFSESSHD
jgi:hypothetical protein